jgi:hypothetical protein
VFFQAHDSNLSLIELAKGAVGLTLSLVSAHNAMPGQRISLLYNISINNELASIACAFMADFCLALSISLRGVYDCDCVCYCMPMFDFG